MRRYYTQCDAESLYSPSSPHEDVRHASTIGLDSCSVSPSISRHLTSQICLLSYGTQDAEYIHSLQGMLPEAWKPFFGLSRRVVVEAALNPF
jgi:hypothetical protein